jgi:monoamine oxidase
MFPNRGSPPDSPTASPTAGEALTPGSNGIERAVSRRGFLRLAGLAAGGLSTVAPQTLFATERIERRGAPLRILIIGAGLAGLVAGYELKKAGHQVTILEATLRPGGRVRTLRDPFSDGLYAEAGAGRIPVHHTLTREYAKTFSLTLSNYKPTDGSAVVFGGNRRVLATSTQKVNLAEFDIGFTPEEVRLGLEGMYEKYIGRFSKDVGAVPADAWPSAQVQPLGDLTLRELMESSGASTAAIRYFASGYEEDSALDFLRDAYSHESTPLAHIVGGNDLLPRAFADSLAKEIFYGAPVVRIEQDDRAARAVFVRFGTRQTLVADSIICAVPFTTLRQVDFSPRLSTAKHRAIHGLPYGSVTRVYLQYHRRFWLDEGANGFADMLDLPMEIWSPTHDQPGERGIQMAYLYEGLAKRVGAMTDSQRVLFFRGLIEKVFPGASRHIEGGASFAWADQPYQQGAYAVYQKGVYRTLGPDVARPEGRIHFAGEHASPWPGWMQGALYSGLRAAREATGVT